MDEKRVQVSFRIPESLNKKIKEIAQNQGKTTTDIFIRALMLYVGEPIPGLCSNCHHQNETGALFCSMCGYPFKEVFAEGAPQEVQDFINMLDGETILKLMAKGIEKRIKDGEISL